MQGTGGLADRGLHLLRQQLSELAHQAGAMALSPDHLIAESTPTLAWQPLCRSVLGVVVVADPAFLEDAFAVLDALEAADMPYVVAVNTDDETCGYSEAEIRQAMGLPSEAPATFGRLPHRNDRPTRPWHWPERRS